MTDYARFESLLRYGATAGFSDALVRPFSFDLVAPTNMLALEEDVTTTGVTVYLSASFPTLVQALLIYNADPTNFVEACWYYTKSTKTYAAHKLGFTAGPPGTIVDVDGTALTVLRARAGDFAIVAGATDAGNIGTFFVQAAVAGTLTLANTTTLTVHNPDPATPSVTLLSECVHRIGPGQHVLVSTVRSDYNLFLQAVTATCHCTVIASGT